MPWSDVVKARHIAKEFTQVNFTPATSHRIRLFTSAPSSAGGGVEVAGGTGYVYVTKTNNATTWLLAANQATLAVPVTYAQPTGDWGTVVAYEIDDQTGLFIGYTLLDTPLHITASSEPPHFDIGDIFIREN